MYTLQLQYHRYILLVYILFHIFYIYIYIIGFRYRSYLLIPLVAASDSGHIAIVRIIVEHGTNIDGLTTALCCSISGDNSSVELVEYLLDSGADPNTTQAGIFTNSDHYNALTLACKNGILPFIRLLLARGADSNPDPNNRRVTPPLKAALSRPEVVKILLEHGANPNLPFDDGNSALLEVLQQRNQITSLEAFTLLLQHSADPNLAKAQTGETLMAAAIAARVEYVKLLLEYGADVTQVNTAGQSVLDLLSRTRKYSEVVVLCTRYIDSNLLAC